MMIYEKIQNKSFQPTDLTEIIVFFYSTVIASDKEFALTFDEFIDWLDEHPTVMNDFTLWMTNTITMMGDLKESSDDKEETDDADDSKKK